MLLFCQHITRFLLTPLFCDSGNKYRSKHHGNEALVYGYIYISLPSSLFVRLCCDIICFDNFVAYQQKQVSWQTNSRWILIKIAVRHTTRIFWIEIYQSHDIKSARSKSGQLIYLKCIYNLTFPHLHIFSWLKNKIHTSEKKNTSHSIPLMTSLMCLYIAKCNRFDKIRVFFSELFSRTIKK